MARKVKKVSSISNFKDRLIAGLFLVLILESTLLVFMAKKISPSQNKSSKMAVLSLDPSSGSFKVGQEFEVKIILDTGDYETDAADIRLSFEPKILAVTKISQGKIYDDYPAKRVDLERGVVIINGVASIASSFKGREVFATISFKGLKPGKTDLIFEFAPLSTTDSNVVATRIAKDVLGEIEGASLEISQ